MYTQDLLQALDVFGPRLVQIYGQGESPMTITYLSKKMHEDRDSPRFLEQMASVGIARSDVEIGIVDEDDRRVAQGESGEIVVRGGVVMNGYWENPEASAQTLKGGWLHTGDVGVLSEDGFLTLKDRTKDMIISGGSNIYPREVGERCCYSTRPCSRSRWSAGPPPTGAKRLWPLWFRGPGNGCDRAGPGPFLPG
ncbi:MAG: hypothetical protein Ct9H300mP16_06650 [Pseudomonadota bacterium]|nr:MAG: hypothetical protein Ct9H300mP16_06650 [Pseudomonadota bacterium]